MSNSATPWTAAHQASLSFTISQSLLKLMCIESVMPSNHLILCRPLLLLPLIFPSTRQGCFVPLQYRAERIAHQQDVHALRLEQRGEAGVITRQHGDLFVFAAHGMQLCQCRSHLKPPIQLSPAGGITSDLAAVVCSLVEWLVVSPRKSNREKHISIQPPIQLSPGALASILSRERERRQTRKTIFIPAPG